MVPHDKESELSFDFQVLKEKLNLEQKVADQAWESYQQIRSRISLEGDQANWLGCAIFVACRNTKIPQEHCVSLTSLLRYSNLSLVQFFDKIKKWAEMTKLNEDFRQKIALLESKVNITFNTFHSQYASGFIKIFNVPVETESRHNRNRKQSLMNSRSALCSTKRVFEFCWLMFITAKSENKTFDQSLVNSYQLLYALFDLIFSNAFLDERRDLFNPNFPGLPPNWIDTEYNLFHTEPPSIIEILYEHKEDLTDVQYCKEYTLKSIIKGWIDRKVLAVSGEHLTLLHSSVFDFNYSSLTKVYESFLSNNGDFDERIFLKEYFRQKTVMETSTAEHVSTPISESKTVCKSFTTPLTCRQYLQQEQISDNVTSVSQNIARLKNILVGRGTSPSKDLINIFKSLNRDPTDIVNNRILELQTKYITQCKEEIGSNTSSTEEIKNLNVRSNLIVTLAYKLLEDILKPERKNNVNVGPLIERLEFISSIFICSVEIVEFSFNNYNDKFPRKFPWSLKVFNVPAFQMIKIIEITIRATSGQLTRNVIKHLMLIEETSLESLMWKHDSELWKEIDKENNVIPKFEDVALPHQINRVFNISCNEKKENNPGLMSPVPSAMETFQSPNSSIDLAKKNTFPDIKPGQSLLQNNHSTQIVVGSEGTKKVLQLLDAKSGELMVELSSKTPEIKPKKGGTLGIILRKFYNLAGVRMFEICKSLNITDFQQKIWTVLEYSVRETDLMKDRHLDQLLMCAVYVVCKLSQRPVQFADNIMKAYRAQPQATSDVYRKVNGEQINGVYQELNLIEFYNTVYTDKVKDFALKFKMTDKPQPIHRVHLSPLPSEKVLRASPRTEILRNVFLKPYESPTGLINNEHTMNYCFNRSTSAELKEINATVNSAKRQLPEEFDLNRRNNQKQSKIAALCEERKVQRKEIKTTEPKTPPEPEVNFTL
ncbi:retinoblastoma-like protein 1 isoform X1 [Onthophagus taurus]|uniref:retinoblastoma-like protein 1 isoform X1 n=1 Tax=Onthophagus taurus TaxID=166361 RepID=UPI0039BEB399